jgi:hypothetical protein
MRVKASAYETRDLAEVVVPRGNGLALMGRLDIPSSPSAVETSPLVPPGWVRAGEPKTTASAYQQRRWSRRRPLDLFGERSASDLSEAAGR